MRTLKNEQYEFLKSEYETLRKEIENSRDHVFKIVAGEAFLIPAIQFLLELNKGELNERELNGGTIGIIYLLMPLLVLVFVSRFLYENNCIFRAGCYIRFYIEPFYTDPDIEHPYLGWEEWLEDPNKHCISEPITNSKNTSGFLKLRSVDKYIKQSFYLLSAVYYVATVAVAWANTLLELNYLVRFIILEIYILLAIIMVWMIHEAWTTTSETLKQRGG